MTSRGSLFITGCYRSGTTLLEKLIHAHPQISIASQPFPLLYANFKEAFHRERGLSRRYPLGHLFLEGDYTREDFHDFLDSHIMSEADLDRMFADMGQYVSQDWTPQLLAMRAAFHAGTFFDMYCHLDECIGRIFPKTHLAYVGSKEILCEEYVPYLLAHGIRIVMIIRDPRDMIASANFRQRDSFVGADRPVLYSLRVWRKSVAFAMAYERHPNLRWLRYEDLVAKPVQNLNAIASWLGTPEFREDAFNKGIFDQRGQQWRGNSSFDSQQRISPSSISHFDQRLPRAVIDFIEACCLPEMLCAGYVPINGGRFDANAITNYRDPFPDIHEMFPGDYSCSDDHRAEELARYENLLSDSPMLREDAARRWFIHERTYLRLRQAVLENGIA